MMMSKTSARERMKMVEEKMGMCICPDCPTYLDCAKMVGNAFSASTGIASSASPRRLIVYARAAQLVRIWECFENLSLTQPC